MSNNQNFGFFAQNLPKQMPSFNIKLKDNQAEVSKQESLNNGKTTSKVTSFIGVTNSSPLFPNVKNIERKNSLENNNSSLTKINTLEKTKDEPIIKSVENDTIISPVKHQEEISQIGSETINLKVYSKEVSVEEDVYYPTEITDEGSSQSLVNEKSQIYSTSKTVLDSKNENNAELNDCQKYKDDLLSLVRFESKVAYRETATLTLTETKALIKAETDNLLGKEDLSFEQEMNSLLVTEEKLLAKAESKSLFEAESFFYRNEKNKLISHDNVVNQDLVSKSLKEISNEISKDEADELITSEYYGEELKETLNEVFDNFDLDPDDLDLDIDFDAEFIDKEFETTNDITLGAKNHQLESRSSADTVVSITSRELNKDSGITTDTTDVDLSNLRVDEKTILVLETNEAPVVKQELVNLLGKATQPKVKQAPLGKVKTLKELMVKKPRVQKVEAPVKDIFEQYNKENLKVSYRENLEVLNLGTKESPKIKVFVQEPIKDLPTLEVDVKENYQQNKTENPKSTILPPVNERKEQEQNDNLERKVMNDSIENKELEEKQELLEKLDSTLENDTPPPGKTIFAHRCEQAKIKYEKQKDEVGETIEKTISTEGLTKPYTDFYGNTREVKLSKYYPEYEFDVEDLFKDAPVILKGEKLDKKYKIREGLFKHTTIHACKEVDFFLREGETLSIVGESGSGKTTLAKLVTNIEKASSGKIFFKGKEVDFSNSKAEELRRKEIQVIFQNPHSSLNPRKTIFKILEEPLILNTDLNARERREKIENIIELIGLRIEHLDRLPHMFSGGQKQRIAIARGLILNPSIVVADEAVSALDVSVQAQILNLMLDLQKRYNLSYLFISHDLSVVRHISHRIMVMYHGEVVETGTVEEIFNNPQHPYTKTLLNSIPKLPKCAFEVELEKLKTENK